MSAKAAGACVVYPSLRTGAFPFLSFPLLFPLVLSRPRPLLLPTFLLPYSLSLCASNKYVPSECSAGGGERTMDSGGLRWTCVAGERTGGPGGPGGPADWLWLWLTALATRDADA